MKASWQRLEQEELGSWRGIRLRTWTCFLDQNRKYNSNVQYRRIYEFYFSKVLCKVDLPVSFSKNNLFTFSLMIIL